MTTAAGFVNLIQSAPGKGRKRAAVVRLAPVCNQPDDSAAPELPEGYTVDTESGDWN